MTKTMRDNETDYYICPIFRYDERRRTLALTIDLLSRLNMLNYSAHLQRRQTHKSGWRERESEDETIKMNYSLYEKIMYVNIIVNFIEFIIDLSCVFVQSKMNATKNGKVEKSSLRSRISHRPTPEFLSTMRAC